VLDNGDTIALFTYDTDKFGNFFEVLDKISEMPLPHYITHKLENAHRYQTVYANELGSAAAPTDGLHFTPEVLQQMKDHGAHLGYVTLHAGICTFRPVMTENIE
jgi:S-adenosylmethionine:tRNA-ribosyltransferase-isomerase (queuine synthetase)